MAYATSTYIAAAAITAATASAGTAVAQSNAASAAARATKAGINNNKLPEPKVIPTINQDKIQSARASALTSLQQRTGRASTLLTSQAGQNNTFG